MNLLRGPAVENVFHDVVGGQDVCRDELGELADNFNEMADESDRRALCSQRISGYSRQNITKGGRRSQSFVTGYAPC